MGKRQLAFIEQMRLPDEKVIHSVTNNNGDVLECTDRRVMLVKSDGCFGKSTFQAAYSDITTVEVRTGIFVRYAEIGTSSAQTYKKNLSSEQKGESVIRASNCFLFSRVLEPPVRQIASLITARRAAPQFASDTEMQWCDGQETSIMPTSGSRLDAFFAAMQKLDELHKLRLLTAEEFVAKKSQLNAQLDAV